MIKNSPLCLVLFVLGMLLTIGVKAQQNSGSPAHPFPQNRVYPHGFKATTITAADATAAYNSWKTSFAENCGNNTWRIKFDNTSETVSEGIAYGMLIAVYHADKPLFDGLWQYYKNARNENGVMHWKRNGCANGANGNNGATDAELDAAMALIIASCQWSTTSPHNYVNDAKTLIAAIKTHEVEAGSNILKPGDKFGGTSLTNPSYFAPAYFRVFAEFTGTDASFWNSVADKCYQILNANAHATTGLVSDWCNGSGTPGGSGYAYGGVRYHYDAARTPWRFTTDYLWNGNSNALSYLQKNVNWVNGAGGGIANIGDSYERDGSKQSNNHNSTFTGAFANAAMASSQTNANAFAQNFKDIPAANDNAYFQRTMRALYYLQLTGNFWYPCTASSVSSVTTAITSPTAVTTLVEGENLVINATATTTTSGTISKVEFFYGNIKIGEDNTSAYSITWNNMPVGKHTLKVVATSSTGAIGESTLVVNVLKAFYKSTTAPTIDGSVDALWSSHNASSMNNVIQGTITNTADLSVSWKALWTDTDVYVLAQITDDAKQNDSPEMYNDDALELYFDIGNDKSTTYGSNDVNYTFRYNDNTANVSANGTTTGVVHAQTITGTGYILEIKIPWSAIKNNTPAVNQLIGFDIQLNDDDNGGARDGKLAWAAMEDEAWRNPSFFGTVILKGTNCTAPGAAGTINGIAPVCQGVSEIYTITNVTGATSYTWTVPAGATISSGQGTNSIQVLWGATGGNVTVTPVNTCGNGISSSRTITVNAASTASVSIAANNNNICSGATVNFTATPTNGGTTPVYQWKRNGNNVGSNSATYSASNFSNNDKITVVMTSNQACVTASPATSNEVTMTVSAASTASVSIAANNNNICSGTAVNFTATPTNGGTTPVYQWKRNGNNVGTNSATYSASNFANNDKITVVMTSNQACVTASPATSNEVTMTVSAASAASVSIEANNNNICSGTAVNFTATPTNGGTTPVYQWKRNGNNVGSNSATYSASNFANNDKITVVMTSNKACVTSSPATSNEVTMTVTATSAASASIAANNNNICSGTAVNFTATPTNGGTTPVYQWKRNGNNVGSNSATYSASNFANNDKITVVMTSNKACVTSSPATSNEVTMTVNAASAASVSIAANNNNICSGTAVNFTATPTNGGTTPVYQWKRNGNNVGSNSATYSASNFANNDKITVVMTSNKACVTASPATSNQVTMNVSAKPTTANAGPDQYISTTGTNLQGNNPTVGTGNWTRNTGSGILVNSNTSTSAITGLAMGENRFTWTISNGVCPSSSDIVSIFVGDAPATPGISGPSSVRENEIATYSVPENSGSQYVWTVPPGVIILSGQGTNEITVSISEGALPGEIAVTETNAFGSSSNSLLLDYITANVFSKKLQVNAYPNPFKESIHIQLPSIDTYKVRITSINGQEILNEFESHTSTLDLGKELNRGVYLIQITGNSSSEVIKVVKVD